MITHTISLELPHIQYPIFIGKNLLSHDVIMQHVQKHVCIVTQKKIADVYLEPLLKNLAQHEIDVCLIGDGEENKNLSQWQFILDHLIQHKHDRHSTIIALGGGVVGDVAGFAAACFMRGIAFIQIPTTLIAQVDAAIGGKTAINFSVGKNLIGAFHQPSAVISDVIVLKTLPEREYISGLAEVVKYGLIYDAEFFAWLEQHTDKLLVRDEDSLLHAIYISAKIKAAFIKQDEKENGLRSLLNFGHTFGHAFESATQYKVFLHGEAVALGMYFASCLSHELNWISAEDVARVKNILQKLNLLSRNFNISAETLVTHMQHDKKIQNKKLNLILLKKIGEAVKTDEATELVIANVFCEAIQEI